MFISNAYAQGAGAAGPDMGFFIMLGLMFVVFYFFLIRPQNKRRKEHQEMVASGWWHDEHGNHLKRNVPEILCLIHSEISEAMEGIRKGLMDDKVPSRLMVEVELADALIRIFDLAGAAGLDLGGALVDKTNFNRDRADHKMENRLKEGGKKF